MSKVTISKFSQETIDKIERNLRSHTNHEGVSSRVHYLKEMDKLTYNYSGARGIALSNMLKDYYKQVGVSNLGEALTRLRRMEDDKI